MGTPETAARAIAHLARDNEPSDKLIEAETEDEDEPEEEDAEKGGQDGKAEEARLNPSLLHHWMAQLTRHRAILFQQVGLV